MEFCYDGDGCARRGEAVVFDHDWVAGVARGGGLVDGAWAGCSLLNVEFGEV